MHQLLMEHIAVQAKDGLPYKNQIVGYALYFTFYNLCIWLNQATALWLAVQQKAWYYEYHVGLEFCEATVYSTFY